MFRATRATLRSWNRSIEAWISRKTEEPEVGNVDVEREIRALKMRDADQTHADREQSLADTDQSATDSEATAGASDEITSQADERNSEQDQQASDKDQQAADFEHAVGGQSSDAQQVYSESSSKRKEAAADRANNSSRRASTSRTRADQPLTRYQAATERDAAALARDRVAASRDRETEKIEAAIRAANKSPDSEWDAHLNASEALRKRAAADRAAAAADREHAARDRERAAAARQASLVELQRAHIDRLTGVHMRELGFITLEHEIHRSRRAGENFVIAFINIDGMQAINAQEGNAAGDALLRLVARVLREQLTPYDPVVRLGGDEFICGFTDCDRDEAVRRLDIICSAVADESPGNSVSVGLSELRSKDSLEDLIARADENMHHRRTAKEES